MGKINAWLLQHIEGVPTGLGLQSAHTGLDPSQILPFIIELESPQAADSVIPGLQALGLKIDPVRLETFILVSAPVADLDIIAGIAGVRTVSYNAPVWIRQLPSLPGLPSLPFGLPQLAGFDLTRGPTIRDPIMGEISLSDTIFGQGIQGLLISAPLRIPLTLLSIPSSLLGLLNIPAPLGFTVKAPNLEIIPTGETRNAIEAPEDNQINLPVAVLDTGTTFPHWLLPPQGGLPQLYSTTGEPPLDGLGHGQWCITCAFGGRANTRFGECRGVAQANHANLISVKTLSNIGFGSNWSVMQAMDLALQKGARVISMSLGGELQGSVEEDPQIRFIEQHPEAIFVIAAGNSGPDPWTVGSPGAAPSAVTVGAWSTLYDSLAIFSSRGPSGTFYATDQLSYATDQGSYGDNLVKPDLVAPGGGPGSILVAPPGAIPLPVDLPAGDIQDQIYSGVTGWTDGMQDFTPGDGWDAMRGTSMACPHAAGLIAWAVDRGLIATAQDVKDRMRATVLDAPNLKFGVTQAGLPIKDPRVGYGMITRTRLGG